jgi:transposase
MKFTFEDKVQIYNERKRGFTIPQLHLKWKMHKSKIKYIVRLVDRHGIDILRHIYHDYSAEFKKEAIYRVLTLHESIKSVSIDLGLSTDSILLRWIKEYKEKWI